MCGFADVGAGVTCHDDNGKVCDGAGSCVKCSGNPECAPPNFKTCSGGKYTAPPTCVSGACKGGAAEENCGAVGLVCKSDGCALCANDLECGPVEVNCSKRHCDDAGLCKNVNVQGSPCLVPAMGTCNASGGCVNGTYVFVTEATFPPNFGSAALADTECVKAASMAGLGGTWLSWTSDGGEQPIPPSMPSTRFMKSPVPYLRLDGQTVANDWTGLTSGTLAHGIDLDENKQLVKQPVEVWTGTKTDGTYSGSACSDWVFAGGVGTLGDVGIAGESTGGWTMKKQLSCVVQAHLYCFQQ